MFLNLFYFLAERVEVHFVAVEGRLQRRHLVQQATEAPNVRPEVVAKQE